jgi:DnaA family protein
MSARGAEPQLTLPLFQTAQHDFASFLPAANDEALRAVETWSRQQGARIVHLRGIAASGKSHLAQAAIGAVAPELARTIYVPLRELFPAGVALLDDLDSVDMVALDDIDICAGDAEWERRLFNLYNAMHASERWLLWTSRAEPGFVLPDLASRLKASLIYQVHELSDGDKATVLRARAHERGLELPDGVLEFILLRERRDMTTLVDLLDELDAVALAQGRALTVPLVREVLAARKGANADLPP